MLVKSPLSQILSLSILLSVTNVYGIEEKKIDCINNERVEGEGSITFSTDKTDVEQEAQRRIYHEIIQRESSTKSTYNRTFDDIHINPYGDTLKSPLKFKMADKLTLVKAEPGKDGNIKYTYKYHLSYIVGHKPKTLESKSGILPYVVEGEKKTDGMLLTDETDSITDVESTKSLLINKLKFQCNTVNGVLETPFFNISTKKISINAHCRGSFYAYKSIDDYSDKIDCLNDEAIHSGIHGVDYCSLLLDDNYYSLKPIATEATQTLHYRKSSTFYVNEKNIALEDQWKCMRFASCQAKQNSALDEEIIKSYSETCKLIKDKFFDPATVYNSIPQDKKNSAVYDSQMIKELPTSGSTSDKIKNESISK